MRGCLSNSGPHTRSAGRFYLQISLEPSARKDHYDIYVEGELFVRAPGALVSLFSIREGFDFAMSDLSCFAVAVNLYLCKSEAYRILARRQYSTAELTRKLLDKGFVRETVHTITAILEISGQLDDCTLAREYALSRSRGSLSGPRRIRQELRSRALPDECISRAMTACFSEETEQELAHTAVQRKFLRSNNDRRRDKIYLFLLRRGFSPPVAAATARRFAGGKEDTDEDERGDPEGLS